LASKMLALLLRDLDYVVEVARVSPSRNDRRSLGLTRAELLNEALDKSGIRGNDLVVYMDEWNTGANFNRIMECISQRVARVNNAFFLPVGLLSAAAPAAQRFGSFAKAHDRAVERVGSCGEKFRINVPQLQSALGLKGDPFFWSESDRLNGYRKMQFMGSLLGSVKAMVENLSENGDALRAAHQLMLQAAAAEGNTPNLEWLANSYRAFAECFRGGYADFQELWPTLVQLEHPSNSESPDPPQAALDEVMQLISDRIEGRKAKDCVLPAVLCIREWHLISPADRYFFPTHAPVVAELTDRTRALHDRVMEWLQREVKAEL
jgi:hypothetical protein